MAIPCHFICDPRQAIDNAPLLVLLVLVTGQLDVDCVQVTPGLGVEQEDAPVFGGRDLVSGGQEQLVIPPDLLLHVLDDEAHLLLIAGHRGAAEVPGHHGVTSYSPENIGKI